MKLSFACLLVALLGLARLHSAPLGNAFTYQGRLLTNDAPANGAFDLRFSLFDAATNGNPVGPEITNTAVPVTNGVFLTTLDFGPGVFNGTALWLAVGARPGGAAAAFTALTPLQPLSPAPNALYAPGLSSGSITSTVSISGTVIAANPSNQFSGTFSGSGSGLTGLNPASLTGGMLADSLLSPNIPRVNTPNIFTGANTFATNLNLPNFANLSMGDGFSMFYNPNHGPADGQGEIQMASQRRVAILAGYGQNHNDAIQIGASGFGLSVQGAAANVYFNADKFPNSTLDPLGYSLLVDWHSTYFDGSALQWNYVGARAETRDVRGNAALVFYNPVTLENPLVGQSPGTAQFEIGTNGILIHNAATYDYGAIFPGQTNLILFDGPGYNEVNLSTNTVFVVGPYQNRSNAHTRLEYRIRPGFGTWAVSFPTNWLWENDSGSAIAPTSVASNIVLHVTVDQDINNYGTTYYARARAAINLQVPDPDASVFFTNAGITDALTMGAINTFVINLKADGLWTNLVAIWPFVGGSAASTAIDLKGNHNVTWNGSVNFTGGVTGDGATAYGKTGVIPSVLLPEDNSFIFCVIKSPPAPVDNGWFMGALDFTPNAFGMLRSGSGFAAAGLNNADTTLAYAVAPGMDFRGFAAVNRYRLYFEDYYVNNAFAKTERTSPTIGPETLEIYLLARNGQGTADRFSNARLAIAGVGTNMTQPLVSRLIGDITTLNSILGR